VPVSEFEALSSEFALSRPPLPSTIVPAPSGVVGRVVLFNIAILSHFPHFVCDSDFEKWTFIST
jgi:hypothetical protein